MRNDDCYTYTLAYPESMGGSIFYVGMGSEHRINDHEKQAKQGIQSAKCDAIRSIWHAGEKVIKTKVKEHLTREDAENMEIELIRTYGIQNLTNGLYRKCQLDPVRLAFWFNGPLLEQIAQCMEQQGIDYSSESLRSYVRTICDQAISEHIAKVMAKPIDN